MRGFRCVLWAVWHVTLFRLRGSTAVAGSWLGKQPDEDDKEPERPHWFRVDLSPVMRDRLIKFMGTGGDPTDKAIIEALELAERIDTPYTPPVDWTALEKRAMLGYSVPDQIWDAKKKRMDT